MLPTTHAERPLAFTSFDNAKTTAGNRRRLPWSALVSLFADPPEYGAKLACPLMRPGTFAGDSRAAGATLETVDALVGEHDAGVVELVEAAERLEAAGVAAIIYSTASHRVLAPPKHNGGPRWRVVVPLAAAVTEDQHAALMSLLNGAVGGALSSESWDWRRCYFFGRVRGVAYEAKSVEGLPLDVVALCPDFDPIPATVPPKKTRQVDRSSIVTDDPVVDFMKAGGWDITGSVPGKVFVRCPWTGAHSADSGPSSTAWLLATATEPAHFRCQHTGHGPKGDTEFLRAIGFDDPLNDFETVIVSAIEEAADAIVRAKNADPAAVLIDRTDAGNMNLLARLSQGDLRHVPERRQWIEWAGQRWEVDAYGGRAQSAALQVAEHYRSKAGALRQQAKASGLDPAEAKKAEKVVASIEAWATQCRNKRAIDAMLSMAKADDRFAVPLAKLDRDAWLFGVDNGVVDLREGQLRSAGRDDLVTRRSPVAFDVAAEAPRWEQFVAEITGTQDKAALDAYHPRPALARYLQKALGYSMTGTTEQHKMFIAVGAGSNGKSILLDVLAALLGDYYVNVAPEALMASRHDADAERPSPVAATLAGARMAVSAESKDGQRLDVALVKRHTGGGFLTARFMRENAFTFEISHKLWLMTNHKPALDNLDDAMRGRLHLIPFDRQWNRPGHPDHRPDLPDGEVDLKDVLMGEAQGILRWLVEGAVAYRREGLEPPAEVVRMTRDFFSDQDPLGRWIAEATQPVAALRGASASSLYDAFTAWASAEGEEGGPTSQKAFSTALKGRGFESKATKAGNVYPLQIK